jgi:serine/threonine protein kinase
MSDSSPLPVGTILENNYKIISELGQGGFARTYLAANLRRFNENCVLKQFAPQMVANLEKASELFEREANVMYNLNHDQIPRFREQFKARTTAGEFLFIVQDYVAGDNYAEMVDRRGSLFSEKEACEFLQQILPVLEYIHSLDVIHRDISPDNIICRKADGKPVLIDFGAVREAAAKYSQASATVIGKFGYAPEEQMRRGQVSPSSDLYALAATILTLLTGEPPEKLYNTHLATWDWSSYIKLSGSMNKVLKKMLSYRPEKRYLSAAAVLAALPNAKHLSKQSMPTALAASRNHQNNLLSKIRTMVVSPRQEQAKATRLPRTTMANELKKPARGAVKFFTLLFLGIWGTTAGWQWGVGQWKAASNAFNPNKIVNDALAQSPLKSWTEAWPKSWNSVKSVTDSVNGVVSSVLPDGVTDDQKILQKRVAVQKKLRDSRKSPDKFYKKVDRAFYAKHPELNKRELRPVAEDNQLRYEWWSLAEQMLSDANK